MTELTTRSLDAILTGDGGDMAAKPPAPEPEVHTRAGSEYDTVFARAGRVERKLDKLLARADQLYQRLAQLLERTG